MLYLASASLMNFQSWFCRTSGHLCDRRRYRIDPYHAARFRGCDLRIGKRWRWWPAVLVTCLGGGGRHGVGRGSIELAGAARAQVGRKEIDRWRRLGRRAGVERCCLQLPSCSCESSWWAVVSDGRARRPPQLGCGPAIGRSFLALRVFLGRVVSESYRADSPPGWQLRYRPQLSCSSSFLGGRRIRRRRG